MMIYLQMIETQEDRLVFERVYHHYRNLMYTVAYNILHNESDAEDAVHAAFVSIAEKIKNIFDPECPKTRSFVVIIVQRKALDILRRRNRHSEADITGFSVGIEPDLTQASAITRCLAKLPERYRTALLLKYRYGYDNLQLAKLLHIKPSNAAKLIQRAKQKLREICTQEGVL